MAGIKGLLIHIIIQSLIFILIDQGFSVEEPINAHADIMIIVNVLLIYLFLKSIVGIHFNVKMFILEFKHVKFKISRNKQIIFNFIKKIFDF